MKKLNIFFKDLHIKSICIFTFSLWILCPTDSHAQADMNQKPVLVITNKTMPTNSGPLTPVETGPLRAPEILAQDIANAAFFDGTGTVVGQRVDQLNKDLFALNSTLSLLSDKLNGIGAEGRNLAAGYYASIATISTQLQSGTTPGNPRMVQKLDVAQSNLENLANNVADLNTLAVEIADTASRASYLLDTTRSTFNLSGAVEEDHVRLTKLEDKISASIVSIDRLLNEVNDDISRTNAYLATERNNLRTIALAVSNGDFYGGSLANNPFSQAPISDLLEFSGMPQAPAPVTQMPTTPLAVPTAMQPPNMITPPRDITLAAPAAVAPPPPASYSPRPLAKIKFDRPNVNYEQPIYAAVQEALNRFPNARFELIAVHPTTGNTAQQAIESTRARRSAEKVLRTLTQFGVPLDQIDMSYAPNPEAETSEVHLFLRS